MSKRYYFNNRMWINDADNLGLAQMDIPQACGSASVIALSGGSMIFADRMFELNPARLEILQKVLPAYGEAARPVDLFERERPEVFALPIGKGGRHWTVLGIFNYDDRATVEKSIALDRLRMDPTKTYIAYEFWTQRSHGEVRNTLSVLLKPGSVALFALHEKPSIPLVISTDRHYCQGALELEDVAWDEATSALRGTSLGPPDSRHNVTIYMPETYTWAAGTGYEKFRDFPGYSVRRIEPRIDPTLVRVHVHFDQTGRVRWEIKFTKVAPPAPPKA